MKRLLFAFLLIFAFFSVLLSQGNKISIGIKNGSYSVADNSVMFSISGTDNDKTFTLVTSEIYQHGKIVRYSHDGDTFTMIFDLEEVVPLQARILSDSSFSMGANVYVRK